MKRILKIATLITMALAITTSAMAQQQTKAPGKAKLTPEEVAQVQAKDIAYELGFGNELTDKFITTFCKYRMEMREANIQKKEASKGVDRNNMTEEQFETKIKAQFAHSRKVVDIREKYYNEYRKFLNPRQIERVYEIEKKQSEKIKKQQQMRKNKKANKPNQTQKRTK